MANKFPKKLFVRFQDGGSGPDYLACDDAMTSMVEVGETVKVAVYELVGTTQAEGVVQTRKPR